MPIEDIEAYHDFITNKVIKEIKHKFRQVEDKVKPSIKRSHWRLENLTKEIAEYAKVTHELVKNDIENLRRWILKQYATSVEDALKHIRDRNIDISKEWERKTIEAREKVQKVINEIITDLKIKIEGGLKASIEGLNVDLSGLMMVGSGIYNILNIALYPSLENVMKTLELLEKAQIEFLKKRWKKYARGLK